MTQKSTIDAKDAKAVPGTKARAKTSAKPVKPRPEIPSEDERYELARKAAEARIVRHGEQDRLRNKPKNPEA